MRRIAVILVAAGSFVGGFAGWTMASAAADSATGTVEIENRDF
ncbi:hypothetical protein [Nonomuraea sp. KM90]